ncbi:MAG: hypothetical protein JO019_02595 [Candidatus Kaiserbacteria bacterium]|nr:hypothetical protein [Candidatus Kaiserbacteria bacterium]
MWQIFAILSLVSTGLESIADKWAIVRDRRIDAAVATFWRNSLFFIFTLLVGYMGWLGEIVWHFDFLVLSFAVIAAISGYCYTYLLRKIEVTGIVAETYLLPLIFLGIDATYLHVPLTAAQIVGVVLLTLGGFMITIDGKTHRLKRGFSFAVWLIFIYWMAYDGFEYYLFKYLNATLKINSVSFFASVWLVVVALLLLAVVLGGRFRKLFSSDSARYIPLVAVSKIFDTGAALLWLTALSFVAVSQVAAIGALEPLIVFLLAIIVQKATRFNIRERIDRANFLWKAFAVVLFCAGTMLVS